MGFSSQSSESSGEGYGYNKSLAQSMQSVWGPQAAGLEQMYGAAGRLAGQQQGQVPAAAQRLAGQTMPGAMFGMNQMTQFANPNSELARRQTANLADTVGQEFGRTVLPQIRTGAGVGGNMGGSREALAKGVAAGDAARAISQGATDFYSNAYGMAANAAQALPGMAGQVFNLGMTPFQASWAPLQSLAGIMGGPAVLNRSQAMQQSEDWRQQKGSSSGFGFNLW